MCRLVVPCEPDRRPSDARQPSLLLRQAIFLFERRGLRFSEEPDGLLVVPADRVRPAEKQLIAASRDEILDLLRERPH